MLDPVGTKEYSFKIHQKLKVFWISATVLYFGGNKKNVTYFENRYR